MNEPEPTPLPEAVSVVLLLAGSPAEVERSLSEWAEYLPTLGREWELLVVEDGTHPPLDAWADGREFVRLLRAEGVQPFGTSLQVGLDAAHHPLVFYATLDYPYRPADLGEMLKRIDEVDSESGQRLDLVNGCRAGRPTPLLARGIGTVWRGFWNLLLDLQLTPSPGWLGLRWGWLTFWTRMVFGLRLRDPASGFKLFRKSIFARIPIQSKGSFAAIEVLAKANFLGCFMDEVPIAVEAGAASPAIPRLGSIRSDFQRVFSHPDFGPTFLSPEPTHAESH